MNTIMYIRKYAIDLRPGDRVMGYGIVIEAIPLDPGMVIRFNKANEHKVFDYPSNKRFIVRI